MDEDARIYPLGLVGESNYQLHIQLCRAGDAVSILHETGNPHDDLALCAVSRHGNVLGYVPRSSWLRRAIHDEGRGVSARIKSIAGGKGAELGVVLDVALCEGPVGRRAWTVNGQAERPARQGFWSRLFG